MERGIELKNCTPIKAILMLTIVFYHSIRIFAGGGTWGPYPPVNEAPVLGYISEWFNNFHNICIYVDIRLHLLLYQI